MKKLCLLLALILILGCAVPAYAYEIEEPEPEEPVEPYSYTENTIEYFSVDNGVAEVYARYAGKANATGATIEITLQKRFLLFWWNDVEGGHWIDNFTTSSGTSNHSLAVPSGTYRAVINYKVYGSGGDYDEISKTVNQ
ncbi:MAG: hypothetical protein IKH51_10065 [Clostridia bacterium]|nr:hypothetical protein [Clostridia bacterium]